MHWKERCHRRRAFNEPSHAHELTFTCQGRYPFLAAERTCKLASRSRRRRTKETRLCIVGLRLHAGTCSLDRLPETPSIRYRGNLEADQRAGSAPSCSFHGGERTGLVAENHGSPWETARAAVLVTRRL